MKTMKKKLTRDVYLVGDIHAGYRKSKRFSDVDKLRNFRGNKEHDIIIFMGDFGYPWYNSNLVVGEDGINHLNIHKNSDVKGLKRLSKQFDNFYVVLGNHEGLYRHLDKAVKSYDDIVNGYIYKFQWVDKYSKTKRYIKVLDRLGTYNIDGLKILTVGGATSHDAGNRVEGSTWFPNENVEKEKLNKFLESKMSEQFDLVITHTPATKLIYKLMNTRDASRNDFIKVMYCSTATALDLVYEYIDYKCWAFGHMHLDIDVTIDNERFICMYNDKPLKINK